MAGEKHALFVDGTAAGTALRQSLQALGDKAAITPAERKALGH